MKGVVFNLLERYVTETRGADAYEDILDACTLETTDPFIGPGTYPDADLIALTHAAADEADQPLAEWLRAFGAHAFAALATRFATLIAHAPDAPSLLASLDRIVHTEVHKLYPDAVTPSIECARRGPGRVDLCYRSPRSLCPLLEGFLDGVARHYDTRITWEHAACMLRGAPACRLALSIGGAQEIAR